jgi:hypothetical protein
MTTRIIYSYTCDCCGKAIIDDDIYIFHGVHPELPKLVPCLSGSDVCAECSTAFGEWVLSRKLSNAVPLPTAPAIEEPPPAVVEEPAA